MSDEHRVHISDQRKVSIKNPPGECISHTPAGRVPIRCRRVEIRYDISTGAARWIYVYGRMTEERDAGKRKNPNIKRSYGTNWRTEAWDQDVPEWLLELVDEYRPLASNNVTVVPR